MVITGHKAFAVSQRYNNPSEEDIEAVVLVEPPRKVGMEKETGSDMFSGKNRFLRTRRQSSFLYSTPSFMISFKFFCGSVRTRTSRSGSPATTSRSA